MLNLLIIWVFFAVDIFFFGLLVPGITVENFMSAMLVCVILALINTFIKPLLQFISLPINILTLGLFTFVINALLLWLAGVVTPGFEVDGFLSALLGSIILAVLSIGINKIGQE